MDGWDWPGPGEPIHVEVNGRRYAVYCNFAGIEAHCRGEEVCFLGTAWPGDDADEIAARVRAMELRVVAHAHNITMAEARRRLVLMGLEAYRDNVFGP